MTIEYQRTAILTVHFAGVEAQTNAMFAYLESHLMEMRVLNALLTAKFAQMLLHVIDVKLTMCSILIEPVNQAALIRLIRKQIMESQNFACPNALQDNSDFGTTLVVPLVILLLLSPQVEQILMKSFAIILAITRKENIYIGLGTVKLAVLFHKEKKINSSFVMLVQTFKNFYTKIAHACLFVSYISIK